MKQDVPKIRPIIFSTDEVRATLDGRKTMMRLVIPALSGKDAWSEGRYRALESPPGKRIMGEHFTFRYREDNGTLRNVHVPLAFNTGDVLWVREKWRTVDYEYCDGKWSASIQYADGARGIRVFWYDNSDVGIPGNCIYSKTGWRSPIYMPKAAARLFLRVTDVRVERVQDISNADAIAEGFDGVPCTHPMGRYACEDCMNTGWLEPPMVGFMEKWERLNAKRAGGAYAWERNPYVWVITFERIDRNEAMQQMQSRETGK